MNLASQPKNQLVRNITTNAQLKTTTKNVSIEANQKQQQPAQKSNEQSTYVYKPPSRIKTFNPTNETSPRQSINTKTEGPKIARISDLSQSPLFKGIDGLSSIKTQTKDPSKSKINEKLENNNTPHKDQSESEQNRFQRRQRNKLIDVVQSNAQKAQTPKIQVKNQQNSQVEKLQANKPQTIVRRSIGRTANEETKIKEGGKSPVILRKTQAPVDKKDLSKDQPQPFQQLGYVYKPTIKRTSIVNQPPSFKSTQLKRNILTVDKKEQIKSQEIKQEKSLRPENKGQISSTSNIYTRNRSRESPKVDFGFEVNTKTNLFTLQFKFDPERSSAQKITSSREIPSSNTRISDLKNDDLHTKTEDRIVTLGKVDVQRTVSVYQKPKTKAELVRQNQSIRNTTEEKDDQKPVQSPIEVEQKKQFSRLKPNVTLPKTQNNEEKIGLSRVSDKQKEVKPYGYQYGRKSKQDLANQTNKNDNQFHQTKSINKDKLNINKEKQPEYLPVQKKTLEKPTGISPATLNKKGQNDVLLQTLPQQKIIPLKPASSGYVYQPPNRKQQNTTAETNTNAEATTTSIQPKSQKDDSLRSPNQNKPNQVNSPRNINSNVSQTSYPYKRLTIQNNQKQQSSQQKLTNQTKSYGNTTKRVDQLNSAKNVPSLSKQSASTQLKQSKIIPASAFSLLSILVKKKIKSTYKHSFRQLSYVSQMFKKRQKNLGFFMKKSILLSENYQNTLQLESFNTIKRAFIMYLSGSQYLTGSRTTTLKTLSKTKEINEGSQLQTLVNNMRKPLCLQLNTLVNQKLCQVFKQKIFAIFNTQSYCAKKQPLFQSLNKIFKSKFSQNIDSSFKKIKFAFNFVPKRNDQDILPLFQTRNKKLSKQEIIKYYQNIFQTDQNLQSNSRMQLSQKTPLNRMENKVGIVKNQNQKKRELSSSKLQSQNVTFIKSRIQALSKEISQQQKVSNEKKNEINSKKLELKKQMSLIKRENQTRKRENEELKERLKKFKFINFNDSKETPSVHSQIEIESPSNKNVQTWNQNLVKTQTNEFLNVLGDLFVGNILKSQALIEKWSISSLESFISQSDGNSLIVESLNYLLNPEDEFGFSSIKNDQKYMEKLVRSKQLIEQRILLEENQVLKSQIAAIEEQFAGRQTIGTESAIDKNQEQVQAIKGLVKNYIKERYLWEWIRNSIQKL